MSIFSGSPLVMCVVYVCIVSLLTSVTWARHLGSIRDGVINKEEESNKHTMFQNPSSKDLEKTELDISTVPLSKNVSTTIMQQEAQMKNELDDHHGHQQLDTNDKRTRAQNRHENEAKLTPTSNPKGKGKVSKRVAKRKMKQPQAMVSWRVPKRKKKKKKKGAHQQQEQPDFDLDYAPPKVHPPTHN